MADSRNFTVHLREDDQVRNTMTRIGVLEKKGKIDGPFALEAIGRIGACTAVIVGANLKAGLSNLSVEPMKTTSGNNSIKCVVTLGGASGQIGGKASADLMEKNVPDCWSVCQPDEENGQSISSSVRALDRKLDDSGVLHMRAAGRAIECLLVFMGHIVDRGTHDITDISIHNVHLKNEYTGRTNKKTVVHVLCKALEDADDGQDKGADSTGSVEKGEDA